MGHKMALCDTKNGRKKITNKKSNEIKTERHLENNMKY